MNRRAAHVCAVHDTATFLRNVTIFSDLSDDARRTIAARLTERHLHGGECLFRQGEPGDAMFIVQSGCIAICVQTDHDEEITVAQLTAGDFLGEMSIFEHEPRSATCRATEPTEVLRLGEEHLSALIAEAPSTALAIMHRMLSVITERLDNTSVLLSDMVRWGETARRRAFTDDVTGLYNRRFLDQSLSDHVAQALRRGSPLSLVMMDLDHFTAINEAYGHQVGDELIAAVVPAIQAAFRDDDILARYGGDEFTFLLPDTTAEEAAARCRALGEMIRAVPFLQNREGPIRHVTSSMGVASLPTHATTEEQLREKADQALYLAKERGRNRCEAAPLDE